MCSAGGQTPQVSVVVPAYDVAAYLPACLDSLLGQTLRELEVVVVDDGATDDSGAIADAYAARDSRVRVVHIENRGLGAARNEGIRHARGEYLGFCDADDLMTPRALELLLALAQETDAPLVTGNVVRLEGDRRPGLPWMNRLHADRGAIVIDDLPELLGDVFAWNKLFRRDFWDSRRADLAGADPLRGPADARRTPTSGRPDRRHARGRLPLADARGRHVDHPAARDRRRPHRPLDDQADGTHVRRGVRRRRRHRGLPRPGAAG